jgi:hypothetical protein
VSEANDNVMTLARRISVLKRGIETSSSDLAIVEAAVKERSYPRPVEGGGLERRRLLLLNLIAEMDAKLQELRENAMIHRPGRVVAVLLRELPT